MPSVAPRTPPRLPPAEWMAPVPVASRFVLHGDARARAAAEPVWGAGFSEESCRAIFQGTRATLWLGPDEFLLLDLAAESAQPTAAVERALESAMGGTAHALVDVSHRQFALAISGPHAELILRAACPLDLDLGEFPIGMCTRTVFAKAEVVLWRTRADEFHLEAWRSYSGYVGGLLREIAGEFYGRS
jgi:sarcosine oxidase, subunit gamma